MTISAVLAVAGAGMMAVVHAHPALIPLPALVLGALPPTWVLYRRRKRLKAFAVPTARRAGDDRPGDAGGAEPRLRVQRGATEMPAPIGKEFSRVFEEQNLGIPLEESLQTICERIPNLDLKFFTTAVILQRQTGGDLAEILDKIGSLIRDRFRIWGQVQALTGEGRLSGVVLMALPLVLLAGRLPAQSQVRLGAVHRSDGQEDARHRRGHADPRRAGDPQDRQHQGVIAMVTRDITVTPRQTPVAANPAN